MPILDATSALTHAGSLLSAANEIVAPYDLEVSGALAEGYRPLLSVEQIRNSSARPFVQDYSRVARVHVLNGMGVTLGDSVIGLTAITAIKRCYPQLSFVIYRPRLAPLHVSEFYELAAPLIGTLVNLPVKLESLPPDEFQIDLGNHLFWPNFSSMPMIDFFLWALGVNPEDFDARDKSNQWLNNLPIPTLHVDVRPREYSLFCPTASTPIRSMPSSFRVHAVDALWNKYRLPILGFGRVEHPKYRDISDLCKTTAAFIAWIKNARALLATDTAAIHIAAGFSIPTLGLFTTIASRLRVRDYPACVAIDLPARGIQGVHASGRPVDVEIIERAYRTLALQNWVLKLAD